MTDVATHLRRPSPMDAHVGARLRFRRIFLGWSQEKLAERLGLTFQQVQKYEKGVNRIGASRLFALAHVLQVPIQFFYDETLTTSNGPINGSCPDDDTEHHRLVAFLNTREGIELNRAFLRIQNVAVRRSIVAVVRSLVGNDK